ncbi:TPA: phage tail tape measure protein [Streptococcus suis]
MAGKIKGIQIEIGGNTQPLEKALKSTSDSAKATSSEIKKIDQALKFDPSNIVLLTQKQELLGKQIATNKEKLSALKQAQSEVEAKFKSGDIGAEEYRAFQREIEVTKNVLNGYENKLRAVNQSMSESSSASTSAKQSLSTLKAEQEQLASEADKIASSFKAQETAMGSNASEADKLALAEDKIAKQSQLVERQIKNLEQQLELTKSEYGENSTQANKMETELNQAKSTLNQLNNELKETGSASGSAQSGMETMSNTIRAQALESVGQKMGELSQKLFEVGKASLETAASVQASNAQFKTVFGEMETGARAALDKIGSDLDIVPERLQGSFTQIAAFAKTSGMDTAEALNLTERATRAAADGAAFYDKSIEEVTENLQSFLKGNYENDAALGISATETTRNAKANELYGKSFNELSESQKQLTLLQMVEDGQKLAGAFGQASREADGYENVMGNLKQTMSNGMAELGKPILEAMIPVFQTVAKVAGELVNWFKNLPGPIKQAVVIFGAVLTAIGAILPVILTLQVAAAALGTTIGGMFAIFAPIIGTILAVAGVIAVLIAGITYLWNTNESFREGVQKAWSAIQEAISTAVQFVVDFIKQTFGIVVSWWQENQELILSSARTVWNAIKTVVSAVMKFLEPLIKATMKNIQTVITAVWKIVKTVIQGNLKIILGIVKAVMQVLSGDWSGAWKTIQKVVDTALKMMKTIITTTLTAIVSIFTNSWNTLVSFLSNVWSNMVTIGKSVFENLKSFFSNMWQSVSQTASSVWAGIMSTLSNTWNSILTTGQSIFNSIKDFIGNIWNTISTTASTVWNALVTTLTFIWNSIYNTAMSVFNSIKDFIGNIWNTISTTASTVWNTITGFLGGVWNGILETGSNIFNTIKTTISNVFNEISDIATRIWNGIKDTISNTINGAKDIVKRAIDTIKGFFNFDWSLPRIRIPKFDISGGEAPWGFGGQGSMPSVGVRWEYFAKGGILTKPTAFGMRGNKVMVGGEAGAEAVLPLNESTLGMIGDRIMATVSDKIAVNVQLPQGQPLTINLDGKTVAHMLVPFISQEQADRMIIIENGGTI